MAGRLVTIATFDQAGRAHVAKNALEEAGIKAIITDEETVSMLWHFSTAVGGIKVQVLEEDAERSLTILDKEFGEDTDETGEVDPAQFDTEAEATPPEEGVAPPPPEPSSVPESVTQEASPVPVGESSPRSREDYARSLFFIAWLAVAFPPLCFFALYFFFNAAFGKGTLSSRGRYNLLVGGLVTGVSFAMLNLLCCGGFGRYYE